MPLYEYTCNTCNQPFDIRQSFTEFEIVSPKCQSCGSKNVSRIIGKVPAVIAKGVRGRPSDLSSGCGSCAQKTKSACSSCHR